MIYRHPAHNRSAGSIMVTVLVTMMIVAVLVALACELTSRLNRNAARTRVIQQAMDVGDGAMQMLYADWQVQTRVYAVTNPSTPMLSLTPSSSCLPTAAEFPGLQTYSAGANQLMINPATYGVTPITLSGTGGVAGITASGGTVSAPSTYYYKASVDVTAPTLSMPTTIRLRRNFEQNSESAWRFMTFFDFDLEVQPDGANPIVMTGDVHTNGIFYSGTFSLTVDGNVTDVNGFVNGWAPGDSDNGARPISMPNFANGQPTVVTRKDLLGVDPSGFDTTDLNANNDGYRGLIEMPVTSGPGAGPDPFAGNRLYDQAGIKILIDGSNNLTIMDQSGTVHSGDTFANTITAAITTNQTIQDSRELANVRLATIDVSKITTAVNSGTLNFNGIIYVSDTSATAATKRGIRLWRGATLPSSGLSVASDNPVYVWGNYNTGGSYSSPTATSPSTQPLSNTNGQPSGAPNTVVGYTAAPAAIFSDSTTILSNAWLDSQSTMSLSQRNPSNTTVNTGIATGSVATDPVTNTFGLGVEGMVRFLENWKPSDISAPGTQGRFTYYGSFISMWRAKQATGAYNYGVSYTVPKNYWFYDSNYLTNPPKPFLGVMTFSKGRWYLE